MTPEMQRQQQIDRASQAADTVEDDNINREMNRYAHKFIEYTTPTGAVRQALSTSGDIVDKTMDTDEQRSANAVEARAAQCNPAPEVQTPKGITYGSSQVTFTPEHVKAILAMQNKK